MQITQQQLAALQTETSNAALTIAQIHIVEEGVVCVNNNYYTLLPNNYVLQLENDFESWGNQDLTVQHFGAILYTVKQY